MRTPGFIGRSAPEYAGPQPIEALTTTCEGLWVLQALCGVETLPSALLVRPFIADGGPPLGHPGIEVLREAGAIVGEDVHPQIRVWLEALGSPDIELDCTITRRGADLRVAIARRDGITVAATRHEDDITIENIGAVPSMRALLARLLPVCGPEVAPADFNPIMVSSADLMEGMAGVMRGDHTPAVALGRLGLDPTQRRIVAAATQEPDMQMAIAVVRHDGSGDHVGIAAVAVIDTSEGRVVNGPVRGDNGAWWTMITPGNLDAGGRALDALLRTVGVTSWTAHSRG